jgi:hypothetical protein
MPTYDGRKAGAKNTLWKLTVNFLMPSGELDYKVEIRRVEILRQHCTHGPIPVGANPTQIISFTDTIGDPDHAVKGLRTYIPNAEGRTAAASAITSILPSAAASAAAPRVLLLPAPCVTENTNDGIEVVLALVKPGATMKKKRKKKKNAAPTATPAAATDDTSAATPMPSTALATKKSKTTNKKKATNPIDLIETPMYVITNDDKKRRVVAISLGRKWVIGNSEMITGNVANEPSANHWWYQKGPNGNKIAPGNRAFEDITPLKAFLHMMPPEQLTLMLELTNERLMEKGKQELTRQELLQWLGVCILIGSINFCGTAASSGSAAVLPPSSSFCTTCARRACHATVLMTSGTTSGGLINTTCAARRHVIRVVPVDVG